ncbi:phosphatase PAP2 family protein [Halosolutus gelatinilyticus]|uniref:phosphatase PAP2 family protein n=1 Tax=Halosolutus gelatinilyticus TaxID=2931975 RepID=UPI001FF15FDF|nr:phosphatase PAP2 family protein [Halosolutus gelatinilyticus]
MTLAGVVLELSLVVAAMLLTATFAIVGPRRLGVAIRGFRWRLRDCALPIGALIVVLALRWSTQDVFRRLERRVFGNNITQYLFELDESLFFGEHPVTLIQSLQSETLTTFFVFIYIYGYAFLLLFPLVAYFSLPEMDDLSNLLLAYATNYAIGLVCYVLFVSFGPRNYDPLLFEGLLYDNFPASSFLTNTVNQYTNVFPSLHTSLSMTVFFLAWTTRDRYPPWTPIAGFLAIAISVSTMYLGIHWFADVVAGIALALVSVYVGQNYTVEGGIAAVRRLVPTARDTGGEPDG